MENILLDIVRQRIFCWTIIIYCIIHTIVRFDCVCLACTNVVFLILCPCYVGFPPFCSEKPQGEFGRGKRLGGGGVRILTMNVKRDDAPPPPPQACASGWN